MTAPDRIQAISAPHAATGDRIDFIFVGEDQKTLDIHFLKAPLSLTNGAGEPVLPLLDDPVAGLTRERVVIYAAGSSGIPVQSVQWAQVDGKDVLRVITAYPGNFNLYRIRLEHPRIDRYFNDIVFSFKANCPSDLDCEPPEQECPSESPVDFPVNYLARDFWSFRRALLDFATLRYPDWQDRIEADAGIMLAEVMSALGDEAAYYQDRIAREAYWETATQRRSLRRHARLIDYHIQDALGATTWLDVTVYDGQQGNIPAGTNFWANTDAGDRIDFEAGNGLSEIVAGKNYFVSANRNRYLPHCWDDEDVCLPVGCTEVFIEGHHAAPPLPDILHFDLRFLRPGDWVLLKTSPAPGLPDRAHLVRLTRVINTEDPLIRVPNPGVPPPAEIGKPVTHLIWEKEQSLPFELNMSVLELRGNLIPVTAGKRFAKRFITGAGADELALPYEEAKQLDQAVERRGRDCSVSYLYSLPETEMQHLVWLQTRRPEIRLTEIEFNGAQWEEVEQWDWHESLIGAYNAPGMSKDYVLDDGIWKRVIAYQRSGEQIEHKDYASNNGFTVRFGDGEFGLIPSEKTVFQVEYRIGGGRRGNVPANTIRYFDPGLIIVKSIDNPFGAIDGKDPQTPSEIRQLATDAYREVTYRAVRAEDYAEAATRLPWVQRAGASFRWTGSWLSAFVTPDPFGASMLNRAAKMELVDQLDRFRQAGREVNVLDPLYADLDLEITVCVSDTAYQGEVKEQVLRVLFDKKGATPRSGYFSADRYTFGTSLERSTLEAAIQSVQGVRAVEEIRMRRRGWFDWKPFSALNYHPGFHTIIRVENDPFHPERGTLKLKMTGGA